MSTTIDQRVVEMRFDNKQFESNVKTSMSTIDNLKQKLNFKGATKGLEDVSNAAKNVNMSGLSSAVESVRLKFSALQVVGVTALTNITNSAINAGKKIVSALTIDPIMTGFQEYETQINAIQTILANTSHQGTTLQQVNAALDELNTYADKTIYNFTEMTRNIGTFTAAGVDLETSVSAIKGIANLAAVSGSNSTQASTAMYQLSQAIAAGRVSLEDWNSVVNAGMGGKVFQDALKNTAKAMGIAVDESISFRESISATGGKKSWLTSEVLLNTLKQFTGDLTDAELAAMGFKDSQIEAIQQMAVTASDAATKVKTFTQLWDTLKESAQSGWTQTWEILIGDFEEAKALLTELSDIFGAMIGKSADARNNLLYDAMTSNWKKMTDGITEAGLSVDEFENKVKEIAKSHGTDIEAFIEEYGSLEAVFKNGALSSDLLNDALIKMTGTSEEISKKLKDLRGDYKTNDDILKALTESGYSQADMQELVTKNTNGQTISLNDLSDAQLKSIGYTVEQIESIRELSQYSELASGSLKEFMDNISVQGGREMLVDALRVSIRSLISIFEEVGKAWREVFPPMSAEQLVSIIQSFRDFILAIRPSEETLDKLRRTFRGLFSVLSIVKEAISAVVSAFGSLLSNFTGLGDGVLGVTATFGDWLFNLDQVIKKTGIFGTIMDGLAAIIQAVIDAIRNFIESITSKLENFDVFNNLLERIKERMSQVGGAANDMGSIVGASISVMGEALANSKFVKALEALWNGVKTVFGGIITILGDLGRSLAENLGNANFDGILDIFNTAAIGGIAYGITKIFNSLSEPLEGLQGILDGVVGILDGVAGSLEAWQTNLKAGTLLKIAAAVGILAASILVISTIDSDKLNASLGAITVLFADLMGSMMLFGGITGHITGAIKGITSMIAISVAVLILASALKKIADLDFQSLVVGLVGVAGLSAIVVATAKALAKDTKVIISGATQMVIFAAAIKILASACSDLAVLSWDELTKGLVGVGVLLASISIFLNTAKFSGRSISTATGIVILSAAMKILASACKDFGSMSWTEIGKGLASVAGLLAAITLFTNLTGNAKHVISTGISLVTIAAAMKIFASAVKDFSGMSWDEIGRGLTGMAGALLAVTIAVNLMPKNMILIGTGLVVMASALLIIANALNNFGGMSWDEISRGLTGLGGSIGILAIGLNAMRGTLGGSAALLIAATSLAILTPVLKALGNMSFTTIATGLGAIAGAFVVLGVAGALLTPLAGTILALSASLTLIGLGVLGIGAGFLVIGAGLSATAVGIVALAGALAGGATAIVAGLSVIISGIAALIPEIIKKIGEGIIELCKVIADGAPAIGEAIKAIVLTIVDVLVECIPAIADGALELIAGVLEALVKYTPRIVDSIMQFLIKVLDGIAKNLPELIASAIDVLMAFFSGIADALSGIDVNTLLKGIVGLGLLSGIMIALGAIAGLVPSAMAGVLGMGLVIAELAIVLAAIGALAQIPGLNWLINEGAVLLENIGKAIGGFIGGIIGGVAAGITSSFPDIASDLSGFMTNLTPFINGAKSIDPSMMDGVQALAQTILILTAANVIDSLTSWFTGGSSLTKFAEELVPFGEAMRDFSTTIAGMDGNLVANAATAGKTMAEMAATIPNSGGVVDFFTGANDMTEFASQLVPFGEAMVAFGDSVSGLNADAVTNAAIAGKALTELANTVPNSGGLLADFLGENDLSMFGEQLVPFGEAITAFSQSVADLDANAVETAATAGKALTELADTIPNTGGLISFFTGDNDMETFGSQLESFGRSFALYASYVQGVDAKIVTTTANAARSLVTLANTLPENKLFKNETTLDEFGSQLSKFGGYFASYYASVSTIDVSTLYAVVNEVNRLLDMATRMNEIDMDGMGSFGEALVDLGNTGIDGFINAFTNASSRVYQAASDMMGSAVNGANAKKGDFTNLFSTTVEDVLIVISGKYASMNLAGQNLMVQFVTGIQLKQFDLTNTFALLMTQSLNMIAVNNYSFYACGTTLMTMLISGVKFMESSLIASFRNPIVQALTEVRNNYSGFYNAGEYLVQGFIAGMDAHMDDVKRAARRLAREAYEAAMDELDSHSPSRVFMDVGSYVALGFAKGITDGDGEVKDSAVAMADTAIKSVQQAISKVADYINNDIDTQPTIRPVLDLTNVDEGARRLNAMFSTNSAVSIGRAMTRDLPVDDQNGASTPGNGNVYTFTQNNYSPKALSRVEIYRQTKNQFSAMERML